MASLRAILIRVPGLRPLVRFLRAHVRRRWARSLAGQRRRVADYWGAQVAPAETASSGPRGWLDSPQVLHEYVFAHLGGADFYTYVKDRYCATPRRRALSLCCGKGETERAFFGAGVCADFEGVDLSPGSLAVARAAAEGLPGRFSYRVADVERLPLPPAHYDLVIGWTGLHHLRRLDRVFRRVARTLTPDGLFVVNEYVGPPRFRMTETQVRLINACLDLLPEELRRLPSGEVRPPFVPATPEEVFACDPSEAVCSDQVVPLLSRHFAILERHDYGGTLLQWVLHGIIANFDPANAAHRACLTRLFEFEREALRSGQIESDFTFIIAGPLVR